MKYKLWHTTIANCFFCQTLATRAGLLYNEFFVALRIVAAYNQIDVTICKQP
jgi:hypothetical protein